MSLDPLYVLLGEMSVKVLCSFFNWIVVLLGVELYVFFINFGDQTCVWSIIGKCVFPYSWFPFHFVDVVFSCADNSKEPMRPNVHSSTIYNAKCWKQPKCPSLNERIKKLWYIYSMEYYTEERKKEPLPFTTVWMELESIMLSEISQVVKDKYHMISLISGT